MRNNSDVLFGFLTGVVIGAGLAVVIAPQSGEKTRARLKKEAESALGKLENSATLLADKTKNSFEQGSDGLAYRIGSFIARLVSGISELRQNIEFIELPSKAISEETRK